MMRLKFGKEYHKDRMVPYLTGSRINKSSPICVPGNHSPVSYFLYSCVFSQKVICKQNHTTCRLLSWRLPLGKTHASFIPVMFVS